MDPVPIHLYTRCYFKPCQCVRTETCSKQMIHFYLSLSLHFYLSLSPFAVCMCFVIDLLSPPTSMQIQYFIHIIYTSCAHHQFFSFAKWFILISSENEYNFLLKWNATHEKKKIVSLIAMIKKCSEYIRDVLYFIQLDLFQAVFIAIDLEKPSAENPCVYHYYYYIIVLHWEKKTRISSHHRRHHRSHALN